MPDPAEPQQPRPSVFLSYCSQDRRVAQIIRDALPEHGIEVWFDESGLHGGDAWDQKIRRQIRDCEFFMPVISAQTEARAEGYFRRQWRLAVERSLDMADDHLFILPVVIDDTLQSGARVAEKFLGIQWLRLPGGQATPAFAARCRRLVSGEPGESPSSKGPAMVSRAVPRSQSREFPPFPRQETGQKMRFWALVVGWTFQSAWALFNRIPRWLRIFSYVWLAIAVISRGCTPTDEKPERLAASEATKIRQISDR